MSAVLKKAQLAAGVNNPKATPFSKNPAGAEKGGGEKPRTVLRYRLPHPMRDESGNPLKLEAGEERLYTDEELKEFQGTEYSNGMHVCLYDGGVREGDRRDGLGQYIYAKGEIFEGAWKANKRNGPGILAMTTGHRYEGDWKDDQMEGTGREEFAKGEVYLGAYKKGRMHGTGTLDYHGIGSLFDGEWSEGRKHGAGRVLYANGDVFEGTWAHGRREGKGTTTYAKGGRVYESQWANGKLVGKLVFLRHAAAPPVALQQQQQSPARDGRLKLNKTTRIPLELALWRPKTDSREVSTETLMRLQLAFEAQDRAMQGTVATADLQRLWAQTEGADPSLLQVLDPTKSGSVSLTDLFKAWYPSVPHREIDRYRATFCHPLDLLRHRGEICGVPSGAEKGFVHLADGREELSLENLRRVRHTIGGDRFSDNCFKRATAKTDKNTVAFADVLDVWYPNVPYDMVIRSELTYLPEDDYECIEEDFTVLSTDGVLLIENFDVATQRWQAWLREYGDLDAPETLPSVGFAEAPTTPQDALHARMVEGPFKGEPIWPVGPLTLSLKMLQTIDTRKSGWVSLSDLLCFAYPNIPCLWTQMKFLERSVPPADCNCDIHALTQDSVLEQVGAH